MQHDPDYDLEDLGALRDILTAILRSPDSSWVFAPPTYHPIANWQIRPYDFNAGDERSFSHDEAIARARARVLDRGCRQQVRRVQLDEHDSLTPPWLIQDI